MREAILLLGEAEVGHGEELMKQPIEHGHHRGEQHSIVVLEHAQQPGQRWQDYVGVRRPVSLPRKSRHGQW